MLELQSLDQLHGITKDIRNIGIFEKNVLKPINLKRLGQQGNEQGKRNPGRRNTIQKLMTIVKKKTSNRSA